MTMQSMTFACAQTDTCGEDDSQRCHDHGDCPSGNCLDVTVGEVQLNTCQR